MTKTVVRVRNLMLYCIPKNANSAMRRAVLIGIGAEPVTMHHHPALNLGEPGFYPGFRAAFIRHPLDRLVSCWADKVQRRKPGGSANFERLGCVIGMPFADFVGHMADRIYEDPHTRPQVEFLCDRMHFLGCYERLADDWSALRLAFEWLPELAQCNESPRHSDFETYYDDLDLRAFAESLYADDLALWENLQ